MRRKSEAVLPFVWNNDRLLKNVLDWRGGAKGPGGPGRLPARGSHRPERAQLTHSVPRGYPFAAPRHTE